MLSNGPGDPKDVPEAIEMIKRYTRESSDYLEFVLGHQLFALSMWMRKQKK